MRRDWNVVIDILRTLEMEIEEDGINRDNISEFIDCDKDTCRYHIDYMIQDQFIVFMYSQRCFYIENKALELLEYGRNSDVWDTVINKFKCRRLGIPYMLLVSELKKEMNLQLDRKRE